MVNITINNIPVSVKKGTTILNAARSAGIHIPHLCYLKELQVLLFRLHSQLRKIQNHFLRKAHRITSFQAYADLGITQLGARIDGLQKDGYKFKKETENGTNRYGDAVHYTRYSFMEDLDKMIEENINHISI